jgi:hypothetical protein
MPDINMQDESGILGLVDILVFALGDFIGEILGVSSFGLYFVRGFHWVFLYCVFHFCILKNIRIWSYDNSVSKGWKVSKEESEYVARNRDTYL